MRRAVAVAVLMGRKADPRTLAPGLKIWLRARQITNPPASGGALSTWNDLSGGGNSPTGAATYNTHAQLGAYVSFDGISNKLRVATPSLAQPITGFVVGRMRAFSAAAKAMFDAGSGLNAFKWYTDAADGSQIALYGGAAMTLWYPYYSWQIYTFIMNGASSSFSIANAYAYRAGDVTATGTQTANQSGVTLGANGLASASQFADCDISEVCLYSGVLSASQIASITSYLSHDAVPARLLFAGDSISFGTAADRNKGFADLVAANKGANCTATITGSSGQTMANLANLALTQPAAYSQHNPLDTVVLFGGTNDIATGATAAATYTNFVLTCQRWRAAGYKVVAVTMLPRGASYEAARVAYNNSIRGDASVYDALADPAGDLNMGQAGQNTDTTYYNADTVHPNNTGHALIANSYVIPAITWL